MMNSESSKTEYLEKGKFGSVQEALEFFHKADSEENPDDQIDFQEFLNIATKNIRKSGKKEDIDIFRMSYAISSRINVITELNEKYGFEIKYSD